MIIGTKNKKKKSNDKRTKSTYVYFLFFMGSTLVNAIGMIVMNFFVWFFIYSFQFVFYFKKSWARGRNIFTKQKIL